uniref:Uncharacterized protein n=1 Tax=viral metagenome TaxID=1070528 RepID=A0A6M3JLH6_9ZZZZ
MKVKLTAEEKEIIEPFTEKLTVAQCAFNQASAMIYAAEKGLWEELRKINPDTTKLLHPATGEWEIAVGGGNTITRKEKLK